MFRNHVLSKLDTENHYFLISYLRGPLNQWYLPDYPTKQKHTSSVHSGGVLVAYCPCPDGDYEANPDKVLVYETNRRNFSSFWVDCGRLWEGLKGFGEKMIEPGILGVLEVRGREWKQRKGGEAQWV